jgi:hypothetical protein
MDFQKVSLKCNIDITPNGNRTVHVNESPSKRIKSSLSQVENSSPVILKSTPIVISPSAIQDVECLLFPQSSKDNEENQKIDSKNQIMLMQSKPLDESTATVLDIDVGPVSLNIVSPTRHNHPNQDAFLYQEVTRDKASRKLMHGVDCPCCSDYYRLTKNLKPVLELGQIAESRKQIVSRHRFWSKKPETPPGFWQVDFPSTQEIEDRRK